MRLLLDSNALLWWLDNDGPLMLDARELIDDVENEVVVSVASVWELAIKSARGRLSVPDNLLALLDAQEVEVLDITAVHAFHAAALPPHHGDPFDRMLIAQAQLGDYAVVTSDRRFVEYGIATVAAR